MTWLNIIFSLLIITTSIWSKPLSADHEEMHKELILICQENEKATDVDVTEYNNKIAPSTKTGECLHTCILEHVGVVKDGKLSVEGTIQLTKITTKNNNDAVSLITDIASTCKDVIGSDRCDTTTKIIHCAKDFAKKKNIDFKSLM